MYILQALLFRKAIKVSDISFVITFPSRRLFFLGQLSRQSLVRFWSLQHIGVFPSIHPEAFGISAAEIMCSGLLLCSTGVGGASEVFTHGHSGLAFEPDNPDSLVSSIISVLNNINLLSQIPLKGHSSISQSFSVTASASIIEEFFLSFK